MTDRDVILKLAKVIIAAAWADGEISNDEINSLKELLFRLRVSAFDDVNQLDSREWALLEMYLETPVEADERARLVVELQNALKSESQKQLARRALEEMVAADGTISAEEEDVLAEIGHAIDAAETGVLGGLQRLIGSAVQQRIEAVSGAPNRELFFEDFVKNRVYYNLQRRLEQKGETIDIPDDRLRKLSLAGGLMAKIAQSDRQVTDDEFNSIVGAMQHYWQVPPQEATFVAEVAVSAVDVTFDTFRMIRELAETTTVQQRRQFVCVLFVVAAADGKVANEETEEIRIIARGLNLTHKDFIDGKLKAAEQTGLT